MARLAKADSETKGVSQVQWSQSNSSVASEASRGISKAPKELIPKSGRIPSKAVSAGRIAQLAVEHSNEHQFVSACCHF